MTTFLADYPRHHVPGFPTAYRAPSRLETRSAARARGECCLPSFGQCCISLSKSYNMTGWRIAFACGNERAVKRALGTVKNNLDSGQFTAVQDAAIAAPDPAARTALPSCARFLRATPRPRGGRVALHRGGSATRRKRPSTCGRRCAGETSASFATRLLEKAHVVVTPGSGYGPGGEGYIRISLTTPDDRLLEAAQRMKAAM